VERVESRDSRESKRERERERVLGKFAASSETSTMTEYPWRL